MDVDILPPGHGPLGTRADATDHRRYVEDLHHAVLEAARAGQSLEEMQAGVTRDRYRDWDQYQGWLPMNLEGRYTR
jgi:hypothetical protein